jgi:hypothetical protein
LRHHSSLVRWTQQSCEAWGREARVDDIVLSLIETDAEWKRKEPEGKERILVVAMRVQVIRGCNDV